jgi:hypothetical protein
VPEGLAGMTGGQAEMDAGGHLADAAHDLDEAQRDEQPVRRAVHQEPDVMGPKAVSGASWR